MLIYRGKMPLPQLSNENKLEHYADLKKVGVASSHESYAPLSKRIAPCPKAKSIRFSACSVFHMRMLNFQSRHVFF
jgi:hypothetical protein